MSKEVVIVSAKRTPIGSFGGAFKNISAVELGKVAVEGVLKDTGINPQEVDELIFGNVLHAGLGQNVARQVAIGAGLPVEMPAFTIDMVCGSGLKTIELGTQKILCGDADVVLVGGCENMSQAPYILPSERWGARMGNQTIIDTMVNDGLTDVFNNYHMGITAENIAEKYAITREQQDEFAYNSQMKASAAQKSGKFKDEIVPVTVPQRKGDAIVVADDEYLKPNTTVENLAGLRPAFKRDGGTVTAGNASGINDGGAAILLMSSEKAESLGLKPIAKIKGYGSAGVDPSVMGIGPVPATRKALERAGLEVADLDLVEANEAFASQAIAVVNELGLNPEIVNVNGGAIAIGHPIGCSGARILVTLLAEMTKRDSKYGLATLCIGGGQGTSVIVEKT